MDKNIQNWFAQSYLLKKDLGFYKGTELPDPDNLLEGTGKISRYVDIKSDEQIISPALKNLVVSALAAYRQRMTA